MNVLELYDSDGMTGVARVVATCTAGLRRRGHQVVRMAGHLEDPEADSILHPPCAQRRPGQLPGIAARVARECRRHRIDVVHVHHRMLALAAWLAASAGGAPVVEHVHSVFTDHRLLSFRAHRVVSVSPTLGAQLAARYPRAQPRLRVCRTGLAGPGESPRAARAGADGVWLAAVGRVEPAKRPAEFIELVARLQAQGLPVRGRWFGDGPLLDGLRPGAAGLVEFPGGVDDVPARLAGCDVFVSTSEREGVPFGLLEAMAAGLPVVARAVGGIGDVVDDAVGAALAPGAGADDFAAAVAALAQDPARRAACGANARARVRDEWDAEQMVGALESVLRECALGAGR